MARIKKVYIFMLIAASILAGGTHLLFHATQSFSKYFQRGKRLYDQGRYEHARGYFAGAVRFRPTDRDALHYLLWCCEKLADADGSHRALKRIWEAYPDDQAIVLRLADSYSAREDYGPAYELYIRMLDIADSPDVRRRAYDMARALQQWENALLHLQWLLTHMDATREDQVSEADLFSLLKRYPEAIAVTKQLRTRYPNDRALLLKEAELCRFAGQNERAQLLYEEYLKRSGE